MEAIVVIVGFLGAGKTTLLKQVVKSYVDKKWNPFMILNDYENAEIDAKDFLSFLDEKQINTLSGSCICCSGVKDLIAQVNSVPPREKGITLIEANGTTDAVSLMGYLGGAMKEHFLPPVQIAVVDVRNWQKRGYNNELERNQVQVSSVIVLNFVDQVDILRLVEVEQDLQVANPQAIITHWDDLDMDSLPDLHPSENEAQKMEHHRAHWSSCTVDLPDPISKDRLHRIMDNLPDGILRVKGCVRVDGDELYSHFQKTPSGDMYMTQYDWAPNTGAKLLSIGPGSDPQALTDLIDQS